ncbi:MAG: C10 family peptidase [Syntrophorhabdaceae bacterium]|nr:C10 family peptidase [Syntrophorhabdaceae bacterium]
MLKKLFIFMCLIAFISVFTGIPLIAGDIRENVAVNFLKFIKSEKEILSIEPIESNALNPEGEKIYTGTIVHLKGGGYILISPSMSLTPIKAYSLERPFSDLPEPYRIFLLRELEYKARALKAIKTPEAEWATENEKRWYFLLNLENIRYPYSYQPGTPLLSTRWDQGSPYNRYLPLMQGTRVVAGCVNVAMAQIFRYYKSPAKGAGVVTYTWNQEQLKAILYRDFNWDNMPDVLDATTPDYKVDEVAKLIRDLVIVNHTELGVESSGATINLSGLIEHFGLSNTVKDMENNNFQAFLSKIKEEINGERPLLIEFPGHLAIADGFGADPTGNKIHVNMGWGGFGNDFYYLDQPIVYDPQNNNSFSQVLRIYYNVKPCSGSDCAPNLEQGDTINGYTITGKFNFPYDGDSYKVYLKGQTTIGGSRTGISGQSFYITLYDAEMRVLKEEGAPFTIELTPGLYTVRSSLCNIKGTCWAYTGNSGDNYTVNITTQPLTDEERSTIDSALDKGPVILNDFKDMVLNSNRTDPLKILIDARDENGDNMTLTTTNTNDNAISLSLTKNILNITPVPGADKVASRVIVSAYANGKKVEKSFIVMVLNEDISYGRAYSLAGVFASQSDYDTYKVILDGACSISGSISGYSGQPFFTSVKDKDGTVVVAPKNQNIGWTFTRGLYLLGASLQENPGGAGRYYNYSALLNHNYTLTVSCPNATEDVTTIATMLGVDLSGTVPKAPALVLSPGWNFVSFSRLPAGTQNISTVLKDVSKNVKVVWGFDNQTKEWLLFKFNLQSSKFKVLENVESGKGYWIYMDALGNINMEGWIEGPQTITLYEGWNLAGYNGTDGAMNLPSGYIIIWGWDNGQWKAKHKETTPNVPPLTGLYKGKAYWLRMERQAGWQQ